MVCCAMNFLLPRPEMYGEHILFRQFLIGNIVSAIHGARVC
jgi:hypothetical protein